MTLTIPSFRGEGGNPYELLEKWIDELLREGRSATTIAEALSHFSRPGLPQIALIPELWGGEGWLWLWNRAGFYYIDAKQPQDAVTVFTCAYLASIHLQNVGQYRLHKGMPLCNISYAYLIAGSRDRAVVPALLGMAEDALASGKPRETASFTNLLSAGYPGPMAEWYAALLLTMTNTRGIGPLYPETTLDCALRRNSVVSSAVVDTMRAVASGFAPETVEQSMMELAKAWGVLRDRVGASVEEWSRQHGEPSRTPTSAPRSSSSPTHSGGTGFSGLATGGEPDQTGTG